MTQPQAFTAQQFQNAQGVLDKAWHGYSNAKEVVRAALTECTKGCGDGYVMVPVEPTREMWAAGGDSLMRYNDLTVHHDALIKAIWYPMIAAHRIQQGD